VPELSKARRILRARTAANARWARTPFADRPALARRGQAGLLARFANELDPNGVLPPAELARRVENARQEHMSRLAGLRLKKLEAKKAGDGGGP
jgi:hypothetical protein